MQNNAAFLQALGGSLKATLTQPDKLSRFAGAVLKDWKDRKASEAYVSQKLTDLLEVIGARRRPEVESWGLGRFDALNRGSNLVFMPLASVNEKPVNAPVSIPPLWNVHLYDWVQWGGSIQNPLARNIAQVIGIGAALFQNERFRIRRIKRSCFLRDALPIRSFHHWILTSCNSWKKW